MRAEGGADELAKAETRLAGWRAWSEPEMADPAVGMPIAQALAICDRVTAWAVRRYAATGDLLYASTSTLAEEVRAALASLGRERLPRLLVERVIDQALDLGHPNPASQAEAASWRSVPHPGAVWAPRDAVVWWNFVATREGATRSPWTEAERAELAAAGCPADDVTVAARAASAAWERSVLNARERVLFVSGGPVCASDDGMHPLSHRLRPALDRVATRIGLETALRVPGFDLAGIPIERRAVEARTLPGARFVWTVPDGFAARLADTAESATSLENLFSCQLMWALRHVARLRPGRVRSIPDANQLLGNLAHALAREVFTPGDPPGRDEAERRTVELLEGRIDELAAPLRHNASRARCRREGPGSGEPGNVRGLGSRRGITSSPRGRRCTACTSYIPGRTFGHCRRRGICSLRPRPRPANTTPCRLGPASVRECVRRQGWRRQTARACAKPAPCGSS